MIVVKSISVFATFLLASLLLFSTSFTTSNDPEWDKYLKDFKEWKNERIADLNRPMGYLSMVGLYWISEGSHTIGSDITNDIIFPQDMPKEIGKISLVNDQLHFLSANEVITIDGKTSSDLEIFSDVDGNASMFNWNSYYWHVIKRGDQYGIRLKDTLAVAKYNLTEIPMYPPGPQWIINATFNENKEGSNIAITNKVGITYDRELAGTVQFHYNGSNHELLATHSGDKLFIVFADGTTGSITYGGGRFLYVDKPDAGNEVVLDFNRAENPICGFSDYATCPLPRPENFLPFAVTAGEMKVR